MTFQSTVRIPQTTGIVGDWVKDDPGARVQPKVISNNSVAANNVIGNVFTQEAGVANSDFVIAGDPANDGNEFAGILGFSKTYATSGTSAGTLEPTLVLPNNVQAQFITRGYVYVILDAAATIGQAVNYNISDGSLTLTATNPGTINAIPNCTVYFQATSAAGLAIVQLSN